MTSGNQDCKGESISIPRLPGRIEGLRGTSAIILGGGERMKELSPCQKERVCQRKRDRRSIPPRRTTCLINSKRGELILERHRDQGKKEVDDGCLISERGESDHPQRVPGSGGVVRRAETSGANLKRGIKRKKSIRMVTFGFGNISTEGKEIKQNK